MALSLQHILRKPFRHFVVLTGLALATPYAFAPYYHFWLMPILFAGLVILTELRPNSRVITAYWFGLVAYTAQFWWIHTALHDVSGLPNIYAIPLTFLLPAFMALFPAIAFWLDEKHHLPRPLAIGVMLPLLWTITEFGRERVFTGFGWGALGYSQITNDFSLLSGFAPIGGIHLVTLGTAALGCWLVLILRNRSWWQRGIFATLSGLLVYQAYDAQKIDYTYRQPKPIKVALLQGNIPQNQKFDDDFLLSTYQTYFNQVAKTKAEIVLLPETAFPQFLQHIDKKIIERFADQAKQNGSALAVGIPAFTEDGEGHLNAMINLSNFSSAQPEKMQVYAKNHLVPFGEFKPIPQLTAPLYRMMNMPLSDFKRGGIGQDPFEMAGEKVAMNICYEDGFGDELIPSAKKSTLLANASNMAWYGNSNAMWQQLQQSQARALEMGRYLIRAQNNGASAIIDNKGKVIASTSANTATVLEGTAYGMVGQTPYMRLGSSWYLFYTMMAVVGILMFYRPRQVAQVQISATQPENTLSPKPQPPTPQPAKPQPTRPQPITRTKPKPEKPQPTRPVITPPAPTVMEEDTLLKPQLTTQKHRIIEPDKVLQAQAKQIQPQINLTQSEFLSDYPPIVVAAREAQKMSSGKQSFDGMRPANQQHDGIFPSVRQSEPNKRQNLKSKRKKNKKRK